MTGRVRAVREGNVLDEYLAKLRARMANRLIADHYRDGAILDIGCGSYPLFLQTTRFSEKYGLDQELSAGRPPGVDPQVKLVAYDIEQANALPFKDSCLDVVSMLAVLEHIRAECVRSLVDDVHRVLKPGGTFVLTTPPPQTDRLLRLLAAMRLISQTEIEEHETAYDRSAIQSLFESTSFGAATVESGYFELHLNLWATATKQRPQEGAGRR